MPVLVERAYLHNNSVSHLLVKGKTNYVADRYDIIKTVDSPVEKALEAMGSTGDTVTGIVSTLISSDMDIVSSSIKAAKVNQPAGSF